jgi:hypothetical protein
LLLILRVFPFFVSAIDDDASSSYWENICDWHLRDGEQGRSKRQGTLLHPPDPSRVQNPAVFEFISTFKFSFHATIKHMGSCNRIPSFWYLHYSEKTTDH